MLGPYLLARRIGAGGMADVFLARGPRGVCVIKRPHANLTSNPEFMRMFLDEAALVAQLSHPGIAEIYDLGQINGTYYLAMEYVPGFDLMTISLEHERLGEFIAPELCAKLVADAAAALHYAHEAIGHNGKPLNLIHRDVTPHNILLATTGDVKLIDFGVARAASTMHKTQAGFVKGKYPYMSPEQVTGGTIDRRVDVYALGLVLYELLTNTRAIQGEYEWEQIENARLGRIRAVEQLRPNTPLPLREILARCFQLQPGARYATAAELQAELLGWLRAERFALGREDLLRLFRVIAADAVHSAEEVPDFAVLTPLPPKATAPPVANDTLIPNRPTEPSLPGAQPLATMQTDPDYLGSGRSSTGVRASAAVLAPLRTADDLDQVETLPPDEGAPPARPPLPAGVKVGGAAKPPSVAKPLQLTPAHQRSPEPQAARAAPAPPIDPNATIDPAARTATSDLMVTERLDPVVLPVPPPASRAWLYAALTGAALVVALGALWWLQRHPVEAVAQPPALVLPPPPVPSPVEPPLPLPLPAAVVQAPSAPEDAGGPAPLVEERVSIEVRSRVEANVVIDGQQKGTTPWSSTIPQGIHVIGVTTPDGSFQDSKRIEVKAGAGTLKLYFKGLAPAAPRPEHEIVLEITSAAPALITVDGRKLNSLHGSLVQATLREGQHTAKFDLLTEGPPRIETRTFEVRPETTKLTFSF